ncbi:MAG TPA: Xaa-Pro peptidase family protein [Methanomicrobiales archaeon]|jgi:Xaa-Pro aminopeptidase|nr:Xaa-Pro peptidase family protein [Methanomicrobiales archaeon]
MVEKVPLGELEGRLARFRARMERDNPGWEMAAIFGRVNLFYFTGTIQDGVLLIRPDGDPVFWVRRSYERALSESFFPWIRPMSGFRDAAREAGPIPGKIHLETGLVPLALLDRFRRHFPVAGVCSLDRQVMAIRAVKSPYEIACLERAGAIHERVLGELVPGMLRGGMTEAALAARLYSALVEEGHQGIVRFGSFNTEIEVGQIGFGENSLSPTCFNGPGGCTGLCPAAPVLGSRSRRLADGDLVFIDCACGVDGYQTDKTMIYAFGRPLPGEAMGIQRRCEDLERRMAGSLRPGNTPSAVYAGAMEGLEPDFLENFMGFGERRAGFLGHGVGLEVDEPPVIAAGFDEPLEEGMTIALEPKKGVPGVGMVGTENTFLVTRGGGRSLTGSGPALIQVP